MTKLTDKTTLGNPSTTDLIHVVDVSDTTGSPEGTSKKADLGSIGSLFIANKVILINALSDFPTPIAGVITLAADIIYLLGDNVNIGTNRLVLSDNTTVSGIESIVNTLTYTGTDDMFTMINTRNRISTLSISATNGRIINFSDNADNIFRMNDVTVACDKFGLFNSSGTNGSSVRFTNVSPSSITTSGLQITGNWNAWLWEISSVVITGGDMFNFGIATFNSIVTDGILAFLGAGTTLFKGLTASGNINVGGLGSVARTLTSGPGVPLSGISVDDIRWIFRDNAGIQDTLPDAMVSLNNNATETVISTTSTPVKIAGTWIVERNSQFDANTTGRVTYRGERPLPSPIDIVVTINSASGNNKDITVFLALNGIVISNSGKTNRVSAADPKNVTVVWQLTLNKDDFLEVFISNDSDTINLIASDAVLRAR